MLKIEINFIVSSSFFLRDHLKEINYGLKLEICKNKFMNLAERFLFTIFLLNYLCTNRRKVQTENYLVCLFFRTAI